MFKNLKSIVVFGLILLVLLLAFFVFYVPSGSVEGKVNGLGQIFKRKDIADISFELLEYLGNYSSEERAEIFNNIPFALVKENPDLLISVFDESYPGWKELNSFNSNYLMTEVELLAKQNASPIKNTEPVSLKVIYSDLASVGTDLKSILMKVWNIDERSVFVIDGSLTCELRQTKAESRLQHFRIELFDIKTGYVFRVDYRGDNLVIKPENRRVEDDGAFELSEKLGVYDFNRLKGFVSQEFKLNFDEYSLVFDDSFIDKKMGETGEDRHLDLIIYSDLIKKLDMTKDKAVSYAGSMRFKPLTALPAVAVKKEGSEEGEAPREEGLTNEKPPADARGLEKEISVNIFKADW